MSRLLRRYGLYVASGAAVAGALIAAAVQVAREPPGPLTANAAATLTIGTTNSAEGVRLIAPLGGVGTAHFALVTLTWTSKGNACDLDAVMHPDGGWRLAAVGGATSGHISGHDFSNVIAANPDAALSPTTDNPVALHGAAGTVTMLYGLDDTAISRAPAARVWLVDRCGKTKPMLVQMPHTVIGATFPS